MPVGTRDEEVFMQGLKLERVRRDMTGEQIADKLGISKSAYFLKEKGKRKFSDREKLIIVSMFDLTYDQFNEFFFEGRLPWTRT